MHLLYILLILLLVTRVCSEVGVRLGQPALVGELLGGVALGMLVVAFADPTWELASLQDDKTFQAVIDLAVFFLMLLAGLEMRPRDLARATGRALPIAIAGMLVPLGLGMLLGWWWLPESDWKFAQSLFIGVALAITAVPVAVKVLLDLDALDTRVGTVVIASAVIDDLLSLLLLAVLTAILSADEALSATAVGMIGVKVLVFIAVAWVTGRWLLPPVGRLVARLRLEHSEFSLLVVYGLALSVLAEWLGMHFLIGAFAAGVLFTRNVVGEDTYEWLEEQTRALTMGFLAPVFFASIGMNLDPSAIVEAPLFLLALLVMATAGKLLGAGVAARVSGFSAREATAIGSAMNARGAVEIIIADIALRAGLFERPSPTPPEIDHLFSAVVIMAIVTTISSPLALKWLLPGAR